MKITAQDGLTVDVKALEMKGCIIFGTLILPKSKVELGRYASIQRTIEVWSEIACKAWNEKNASYVMPKS